MAKLYPTRRRYSLTFISTFITTRRKTMIQKFKLTALMIALVAILGVTLQSCEQTQTIDLDLSTVTTPPSFNATNASTAGEKPLTASDSKIGVNLTYNITIATDGEIKSFTITCSSNELPVSEGNEVEITASFDDESATSYICFALPDGSREIVTKANPVCKWVVPASFKPGDAIVAQWADKSGNIIHKNLSSSITLIAIEK